MLSGKPNAPYLASGRHKIGEDKGLLEEPNKIGIKHHTNTTDSGSVFSIQLSASTQDTTHHATFSFQPQRTKVVLPKKYSLQPNATQSKITSIVFGFHTFQSNITFS
jgi:hypothetical protein